MKSTRTLAVVAQWTVAVAAGAGLGLGCATTHPFAPPDGSFEAAAAGELSGDLEGHEGTWYGAFEVGGVVPIECWFYPAAGNPAGELVLLWKSYLTAQLGDRQAGEQRVGGIDAGVVGSTPYLGMDRFAVVGDNILRARLRYANKGDRGIFCVHGDPNEEPVIDGFFRGLVSSYRASPRGGSVPAVDFRDVSLVSIGEMRVGYQTLEMTEDRSGNHEIVIHGATLVPSGPDAVTSSDDYFVEWSRPDGTLIHQSAASSDGSTLTQLQLESMDGIWKVRGQMQGKEIDSTFQSERPLLSSRGEYELLGRVASGALADGATYARWMGPLNPAVATEWAVRSLGGSRVVTEAGPLVLTAEIDEQGISRGTLEVGRLQLDMLRVYVEGRPTSP